MARVLGNIINYIDLQPDRGVGILLPLNSVDRTIFTTSYTTQEQATSNLINCVMTQKGERPLNPDFGTNILKTLFEQSTEDLYEYIKNDIKTAVEFWLPYIELIEIQVTPYPPTGEQIQSNELYIIIKFRATSIGSEQSVTLTVNIPENII